MLWNHNYIILICRLKTVLKLLIFWMAFIEWAVYTEQAEYTEQAVYAERAVITV
jgi:hypothetical protein